MENTLSEWAGRSIKRLLLQFKQGVMVGPTKVEKSDQKQDIFLA